VVGIYQDRAPLQEIPITFQNEIDSCAEKWLTGTDESGQRLPRHRTERLLEGDPFVLAQDRLARADETVPLADQGGYVRDFKTSRFTLLDRTAQNPEGLQEERFDEVRLEAPCFEALHVLPDPLDLRCIHAVVRQSSLFQKLLAVLAEERAL